MDETTSKKRILIVEDDPVMMKMYLTKPIEAGELLAQIAKFLPGNKQKKP